MYLYQKDDYESIKNRCFECAMDKYFNGYSDARPVQENFNLITSFIQKSADTKTGRWVCSVTGI